MIRIPRLAACLLALGTLAAAPATYAACSYPKAPSQIPDGKTASKDEMLAAQAAVKQFMADMDLYIKCVDDENPPPAAGTPLTEDQKKALAAQERVRVQKHNAAVADEEAVAERFNTQRKAYNEAHPK
ncbi:MAG TPA: hypothetical protein VMU00_02910 [Steroidobacteraceae bacterium]|nr:hypothetical protein [Steroidobacteraceae bacterium]